MITSKLLNRFIRTAGERLHGDWVILGGAVLHCVPVKARTTLDIDLAAATPAGDEDPLALMEIANDVGLPVEAVNQAGAFYLRRIEGWREHLVVVHRGENAVFYRPDATLFLLLKINRLTETDLADCFLMLNHAQTSGETLDTVRLKAALDEQGHQNPSPGKAKRLSQLRKAFSR